MRYLFTLANLLLCLNLTGQNFKPIPNSSSTNHHHAKAFCGHIDNKSLEDRQQQANQFRKWEQMQAFNTAPPIRTIPVVIHLLEYDPVITNDQVEKAIASLNNAFSHSNNDPNGADFSGGTRGVDTRIEFCLAQRAPDGGITNGIVRWRTDYENMDIDLEDAKLKTQGQWDPRYYLNIWVLNHLDTESDQSYTGRTWWNRKANVGGYSAGPGGIVGYESKTDGVIVTGTGASLVAHEIGHYFDLAHTFSSDCANGDCLVNGDGICDTPPDKSQEGCGQNTCNTDTLSNYSNGNFRTDVPDMTSNFMDYSSCPSEFTQGQADKMLFIIDNFRVNLATEPPSNNDACTKPCNADFSIEFSVSERYPEPNVPVDFTSTFLGAGIDSYEWYVERLGHPGFNYAIAWEKGYTPTSAVVATSQDLQYDFPEPGKYRVYLKAWDSNNPDCYTSYSRTIRVTCLGIDARFTPSVRFIAAKQPKGKLVDNVVFRNRSVNATAFEWFVRHEPYDNMAPAQPEFWSDTTELDYTFKEPGDYFITLIAKNGATCQDTCGPFKLPVDDPTIDGEIKINQVDCYKEDSLRINFKIDNSGYDSIRIGTPITFYDEDPRKANPTPKALGTYYIEEVVYGKDRGENFRVILPVTRAKLDQLWAVFNDLGSTSFPISWPMSDRNVMSVNSEFPPSGHNELEYDNNYGQKRDFQFRIDLELEKAISCTDETAQLYASYINTGELNDIEWIPNNRLSCNDCLDPVLTLPNEDYTQSVILTSEYYCKDTISLFIPTIKENVPIPQVTNIPDQCIGAPAFDLSQYVNGTNLIWYNSERGGNGQNQAPQPKTDASGTFSYWISQTLNDCEGPRVELSYTIKDELNAPVVNEVPNICVDEVVPDLGVYVSGANLLWYDRKNGGVGKEQAPILASNLPGTFRYWVSRQIGGCESQREEISLTVIDSSNPPVTPGTVALCYGSSPPELKSLVPGSNLRWYPDEIEGNGSVDAPIINTNISGDYSIWVSQTSANCESPRAEIVISIANEVSPPQVLNFPEFCVNDPASTSESLVNGAALKWYEKLENDNGTTTSPLILTQSAGVFTFWVTQTKNNCESNPTEFSYTVHPSPNAPEVLDLPNLCVGEEVPSLTEFINGKNLKWYVDPDSASISAPLIKTDSAQVFKFWVSQSQLGCEGPQTPLEIVVSDIMITPGGPYEVVEGGSREISASISVFPEDEPYFVQWLDAAGKVIDNDVLSTIITPNEPTYYTIMAEANGCLEEADILVDLIYQIDPTKIFSPNGDGKNDSWYIEDIDKYPDANLTVYNRWGSVVYEAEGYTNDWQGTWQNGKSLPVATYYFVISLNEESNKTVTGSVTIIR